MMDVPEAIRDQRWRDRVISIPSIVAAVLDYREEEKRAMLADLDCDADGNSGGSLPRKNVGRLVPMRQSKSESA